MFTLPEGEKLTKRRLEYCIEKHKQMRSRYQWLRDLYEEIYYWADIYNEYFIGNPIEIHHPRKAVAEYLKSVSNYNNQEEHEAELTRQASIYGHTFELLYLDEQAEVCMKSIAPEEGFLIYDGSIARRPLYGVHYYECENGEVHGMVMTRDERITFRKEEEYIFEEASRHYFGGVPMVEFMENQERRSILEKVKPLLYEETLPIELITYTMDSAAQAKERKFKSALNKRYQLLGSLPFFTMGQGDWMDLTYRFTRRRPLSIESKHL